MSQWHRPIAVAVLLALAVLLLPAAAGAKGPTAREALPRASAEAHKWQADAVLFQVGALEVGRDGRLTSGFASQWQYYLYSAKARKTYTVLVAGDVTGYEGGPRFTQALGEFVDSDRALSEARKNAFAPKGKISIILAYIFARPLGRQAFVWYAFDNADPKYTQYYVDAKPGAFVGRNP